MQQPICQPHGLTHLSTGPSQGLHATGLQQAQHLRVQRSWPNPFNQTRAHGLASMVWERPWHKPVHDGRSKERYAMCDEHRTPQVQSLHLHAVKVIEYLQIITPASIPLCTNTDNQCAPALHKKRLWLRGLPGCQVLLQFDEEVPKQDSGSSVCDVTTTHNTFISVYGQVILF